MKLTAPDFDVIIVGASIAGASLAILLGQSGISTALIDRAEFPRSKACGEGICSMGVAALHRMGLGSVISETPHMPLTHYSFIWDKHQDTVPMLSWVKGGPSAIGIERRKLDLALLNLARAQRSVQIFTGEIAHFSKERTDRCELRTLRGELSGRYIVDASGGGCSFSLGVVPPAASDRYGWTNRYCGKFKTQQSSVTIFFADGYEIYATPIGPDALNISVLVDRGVDCFAGGTAAQAHIADRVFQTLGFSGELCEKRMGAPYLSSTPRYSRRGRTIAIGDASYVLDPISGMGMTHALLTAEAAHTSLLSALHSSSHWELALDEYSTNHQKIVRPLKRFTDLVSFSMKRLPERISRPLLHGVGYPMLQSTIKAVCRGARNDAVSAAYR